MLKKVIDDAGNEVEMEVFTQDDLNVQIAARELALKAEHEVAIKAEKEHQATKLAEFEQAKKNVGEKEKAAEATAQEAKKIAEEAMSSIQAEKKATQETKKDFIIASVIGENPELKKKILENFDLLAGMPITNDKELSERIQKAVSAAGINSMQNFAPSMSFGGAGAGAPPAQMNDIKIKEHNYDVWKNELGLKDFIPKSDNK